MANQIIDQAKVNMGKLKNRCNANLAIFEQAEQTPVC